MNSPDIPRTIPFWLKIWIFFNNPIAILGTGFLAGSVYFSFLLLVELFNLKNDLPRDVTFRDYLPGLAFTIAGSTFCIPAWQKAKQNIRLLTHGVLTRAEILSKEATNIQINKQRVYKIHFQFKAQDNSLHEVFVKTHRAYRVDDEAEEPLMYDPLNPSSAVLLDTFPWPVRRLITGNSSY